MSGSTIQTLDIQYLHQPPFDTLSAQQRTYLQQHSKIVYLDNLQPIPTGWQGDFFIILKGCVHQLQGDALISTLNAGDWFDTKVRQNGVFNFITQQQSLMYRIDGQVLSAITEQNPTLKTPCLPMSLPVSTITKPALPKVKVKNCYINRLPIWDSISNRRILSMIQQRYTMPRWR